MKKNTLKKLSKYTTSSAAMLVVVSSANAAIQYTDVNPDDLIDQSTNQYALDLNGDGNDDFFLQGQTNSINQAVVLGFGNIPSLSVGGVNNQFIGYSGPYGVYASNLSTSSNVGPLQSFVSDSGNNAAIIASAFNSISYGLGNSTNSYLGVQFEISGLLHYGWIRVNTTAVGLTASVTILDYAYEDVPNTPIQVGAVGVPVEDLSLSFVGEYTYMPFDQANGMPMEVTINNVGGIDATDAIVQTDVFLLPNTTTPIQSITSSTNSILGGNTTTIMNGNFAPTIEGNYYFRHVVSSALFSDVDASNDTVQYTMNIEQTFGRDANIVDGSLGIGAGAAAMGVLGQNYTLNVDGSLDSVAIFINGGANGNTMVGQPLSVSVYNTTAGTPNSVIGTTDTIIVTTAGPHFENIAISGGPLTLTSGTYFLGAQEADSNLTIGYSNNIFTPGATWVNWTTNPNGTWSNGEVFNFFPAFILRPHFGSNCTNSTFNATPVVACGSAVINGNTYTTSQTVMDTLIGANSCGADSIIITPLTINNAITSNETLITCGSATINGTNYTTSQIVTDVFTGGASTGCDSTHITNLTISTFVQANYTFSGCSSVTAFGNTYTSSQIVRDTIFGGSSIGCDSITVSDITVNMPTTSSSSMTVCGSATINGSTYTTSQNVIDVFTGGAANGCDSTHTTNLTVNNAVTSNSSMTVCGSATINGSTYTTSQNVIDVFAGGATNGCDSTHTTNLTIDPTPVASAGSNLTVCADSPTINLAGSVTGATGGSWSGGVNPFLPNNTTLNATYTPSQSEINIGSVTLTLMTTGNGVCTAVSDQITITIAPMPTANAGANTTTCSNDLVALNGTITTATGATWSNSGNGTFSPSNTDLNANYTPGSIDINNGTVDLYLTTTGNGACNAVMDTMTIEINPEQETTIDTTISSGGSIIFGGNVLNTAGVYYDTLQISESCDSIITLNLLLLDGINDARIDNLKIYPNPTNDKLFINAEGLNSDIKNVKLIDIQGKELMHFDNLNTKFSNIDMSELEDGIYFMKVELADGNQQITRVVKMK